MSQKLILIVVLGVAVAVILMVVVYRQLGTPVSQMPAEPMPRSGPQAGTSSRGMESSASAPSSSGAQPASANDIVKDIERDVASDSAALDVEEAGELSDIESDSQSVNDLGKAYDENSF